jgi:hypothetical protein
MAEENPEAKPRSRATVRSRGAGLPLDGGGSGGNRRLSGNAVVYCPRPPFVMEALNAIPESTYFFWTGLSTPKTAAGIWQESLKRLFV